MSDFKDKYEAVLSQLRVKDSLGLTIAAIAETCGVSSTYVVQIQRQIRSERQELSRAQRCEIILQKGAEMRAINSALMPYTKTETSTKFGIHAKKCLAVLTILDDAASRHQTEREIAEKAGVSRATVRSIRNNPGKYAALSQPSLSVRTIKYIKCAWCGGLFEESGGMGRKSSLCGAECKQAYAFSKASERSKAKLAELRKHTPAKPSVAKRRFVEFKCKVCGQPYTTRLSHERVTCGIECERKYSAVLSRERTGTPLVNCPVCSKEFSAKVSGRRTNKCGDNRVDETGNLRRATFCSKKCYRIAEREALAPERAARAAKAEEDRMAKLLIEEVDGIRRLGKLVPLKSMARCVCQACSKVWVKRLGPYAIADSVWNRRCGACRAIAREANRRKAIRIGRKLRKARLRGVKFEKINPYDVFEADGWKCYLCGCDTPKSKRRSYDDDAPELEHVTPLAKGGTHTRDNVRCSCRKCNRLKSDNILTVLPEVLAQSFFRVIPSEQTSAGES